MSKRANGEGTYYRAKDGSWRGAIGLPNGKRKFLRAQSQREIREKIERLHELSATINVDFASVKTAAFLAEWLELIRPSLKAKTWERYEGCVRCHISPALGRIPVGKLEPRDLQGFYAAKIDSGLSPSTVHQLHRVLHSALAYCVHMQLLATNPAEHVHPPRRPERTMNVWSTAQCRQFLESVASDRFHALFVLALTTGMRQGELLALHWSDVDLDRGTLLVRGTLSRTREGLVITTPKTSRSSRQILLTSQAVDALRVRQKQQHEEIQSAGAKWENLDIVFSTIQGGLIDKERVLRRHFKPAIEEAGLPPIRFHDLRHCAATIMIEAGVHIRVVADILGHADPSVTLRVYGHVMPAMHQQARSALESAFDRNTPQMSS